MKRAVSLASPLVSEPHRSSARQYWTAPHRWFSRGLAGDDNEKPEGLQMPTTGGWQALCYEQ
jgi:hypothetical protein